jgi:hypothetical protein
MNFKKLGVALLVVFALSAVSADSVLATAVESTGSWSEGGTPLKEPVGVLCDLPVNPPSGTLVTTVEATAVELKWTGLTCPESQLYNESSKAKAKATLKFSGVTVVKPAGCAVSGGSITTAALAGQVFMEGSKALLRYAPASGSTFATFKIGECAIAGSYTVKGSEFGEMANPTGVVESSQVLKFSGAINSAAGGSLTAGGNPVVITEQPTVKLKSGGIFSVHE